MEPTKERKIKLPLYADQRFLNNLIPAMGVGKKWSDVAATLIAEKKYEVRMSKDEHRHDLIPTSYDNHSSEEEWGWLYRSWTRRGITITFAYGFNGDKWYDEENTGLIVWVDPEVLESEKKKNKYA